MPYLVLHTRVMVMFEVVGMATLGSVELLDEVDDGVVIETEHGEAIDSGVRELLHPRIGPHIVHFVRYGLPRICQGNIEVILR